MTDPVSAGAAGADAPLLEAAGLVKRYGELVVLDGVGVRLAPGDAIGVVGPNGAGKTTLLGVLAGSVEPNAGTVKLRGDDVTRLGPAARCRLGIARAHQVPKPFGGMTVLENVLVGASSGAALHGRAAYVRCVEVLERCGMADLANRRAETLGLLHRKRLELARALATGPAVVLLDEIGAGLTDAETDSLVATIRALRQDRVAVVWIEHIVHVLVQVVDRLICMDAGRVIADGPPRTVMQSAVVIDAYLGKGAR